MALVKGSVHGGTNIDKEQQQRAAAPSAAAAVSESAVERSGERRLEGSCYDLRPRRGERGDREGRVQGRGQGRQERREH